MNTLKNNDRRSFALTFILTCLLIGLTPIVYAQQTNFSGSWVFKNQESISGNLYINGSPKKVTVQMVNGTLSYSETVSNGSSDTTITQVLTAGQTSEVFTSKTRRRKTSALQMDSGGNGFILVTTIYTKADPQKPSYRNTDTWTLENGQMVLDRKSENFDNGETWESKAYYSKD